MIAGAPRPSHTAWHGTRVPDKSTVKKTRGEGDLMSPLRKGLAAGFVLAVATGPAPAQQYPSQTITITVAAAAGGFADGVARLIGEKLGERLGQTVVVENKGGAAGNL